MTQAGCRLLTLHDMPIFCGYILLVFSVFRMAAEHVECFVPQALKCLEKTFLLFRFARSQNFAAKGPKIVAS